MSRKNSFGSLVSGVLLSVGKSLVTSELKKKTKGIIGARFAKTPSEAHAEAAEAIGYETSHYQMDKQEKIVFKSSPIFFNEWLNKSPSTAGKIVKDEENGQVYFNGVPMTPAMRVNLITKFGKDTKINSPALSGHFDAALELFTPSDMTSISFQKQFDGWNPTNASVIDSFLENCFGDAIAPEDLPHANLLFKKWIIGTAGRIISPGSSHDGCLTFTGPPGIGKTQFFRQLLPEPFSNRTGEIFCNIKNPQKFVESIVGKSIACFDELSVLDYAKSQETFKQLLTSQFVDVRMVWARKPQRYALRQGFCATTNKNTFIPDKTFSRRLWVIQLQDKQSLNFDFHSANKADLWREAVYLSKNSATGILSYNEQKVLEEKNSKFLI